MKVSTKAAKAKKALSQSKQQAKKEYIQKKPSQVKRAKAIAAAKTILDNFNNHKTRGNGRDGRIKSKGHDSDEENEAIDNDAHEIEAKVNVIDNYNRSNELFTKIPSNIPFIELTTPQSMSRLLYCNPVCFLTTYSSSTPQLNAMVISWLMPTNNYGGFACTIHKSRFTAELLSNHTKEFVLSVPTALHRETLLAVGKVTGKNVDKFDCATISQFKATDLGKWNLQSTIRPLPDTWKKMKAYELKDNLAPHIATSILNTHSQYDTDNIQKNSNNKFAILNDEDDDDDEEKEDKEDDDSSGNDEDDNTMGNNAVDDSDENECTYNAAGDKIYVAKPYETSEPITDNINNTKLFKSKASKYSRLMAVSETVAHMKCSIVSMNDACDPGHYLVLAQANRAFVHPSYWNHNGKCFVARGNYPPTLKFLGSQVFGYINASGDEFAIGDD